jgi:hypothetical protein
MRPIDNADTGPRIDLISLTLQQCSTHPEGLQYTIPITLVTNLTATKLVLAGITLKVIVAAIETLPGNLWETRS